MISIRRQLTRDLMFALLVLLGAGLIAIGAAVRWALTDSFDAALRARAMTVTALTEIDAGQVAFDFSADFLAAYGGANPRNYFELWDSAGVAQKRSPSLGGADLEAKAMGTAEHPKYWNATLPNHRPGRAVGFLFAPTLSDGTTGPSATRELRVVTVVDRQEFDETLGGLLIGITGCGAVLLVAVFLVVPRVLRRGLGPLEHLGEQAAQIDAASLATRFEAAALPAELQPIAGRLNDLLARLEVSFERERRFSADLAHELRTPLAELRLAAECALKWPESRDSATDRETLAITKHMETIVTHLLALARGEQGQLAGRAEPLALEQLVAEVWRPFAARAEARNLTVHLAVSPVRADADPALMRSILVNLFDNAVAYTLTGGEIEIMVEQKDGRVCVRVANTTDQLEPTDVAKLFDRFWRKETARTGGEHVGLGLSLARMMALATGWRLSAALEAGGKLAFKLQPA